MRRTTLLVPLALVFTACPLQAQQPDVAQIKQEREIADRQAPKLAEVLRLKPGMTVADIGSGGGAFSVVLGHWIGTGKVFATDINDDAIRETRDYAAKEGLKNVTVVEGGPAATNLPVNCCDAVFMRDVYHHIMRVDAFNASLLATLKPGGRLAIIDFRPRTGSALPDGVPVNRGGHGISPTIIEQELKAAGFAHISTTESWPADEKQQRLFLVLFEKPK